MEGLAAHELEELALPDTDSDGLPDPWEYQFFGSLTQTAAADADADGRSNQAEYLQGTLPNDSDTDKDGLNDGAEFTAGTNPLLADSDRDGLGDLDEVTVLRTNPLLADTDSDTFSDRDEIIAGSNPLLATSLRSLEAALLTARSGSNEEARLRTQEADLTLQWVERAKKIEPLGQVQIAQAVDSGQLLLENGDVLRIPAGDLDITLD